MNNKNPFEQIDEMISELMNQISPLSTNQDYHYYDAMNCPRGELIINGIDEFIGEHNLEIGRIVLWAFYDVK